MATTYTGRLLTPTNFGVPSPLDIAIQLGRIPRFVGATRIWPWTVLHHVMAAYLVVESNPGLFCVDIGPLSLMVLLHEADEVATGDIPTTWKTDDMRERQHHLREFVNQVYAPHVPVASYDHVVKRIDWAMMAAEMEILGPPQVEEHSGMDAYRYVTAPKLLDAARYQVEYVARTYSDFKDSMIQSGALVSEYIAALVASGAKLDAFELP